MALGIATLFIFSPREFFDQKAIPDGDVSNGRIADAYSKGLPVPHTNLVTLTDADRHDLSATFLGGTPWQSLFL